MIIKRSIKVEAYRRRSIRIRIVYAGERVDLYTGIAITAEHFDSRSGRAIGGNNAGKINAELSSRISRIEDLFTRYELVEKRVPDPEEVKRELSDSIPVIRSSGKSDLFDAFDEYLRMEGKKNGWEPSTFMKYRRARDVLYQWNPRISFDDISEDTMLNFLQSMYKARQMNATIQKNVTIVNTFFRWAAAKKLFPGFQFRPRLKGMSGAHKTVVFLSWDELMKLRGMDFPEKHLDQTRDCFLFCCFSGLRYSDLKNLRGSDVRKDSFSIVTQKTSERLVVELNRYSRAILDKYKGVIFPGGSALPVISNQKMNDNLKVIGERSGFKEPVRRVYWRANKRREDLRPKYELLTTHCGRRSFIVNALYLGIASEVIMKWTGHADYRAMRPYIAIVDDLKSREMKKFNI